MKEILLSDKKHITLVDDEDYEIFGSTNWHCVNGKTSSPYAVTNLTRDGKITHIRLHNEIMRPPKGMIVDHIDCNSLNNQKSNLRICTRQENSFNRRKNTHRAGKPCLSKYKGVSYQVNRAPTGEKILYWVARVIINNKHINLGHFKNEIDAALAYNEAVTKYHGKYARLNEIEDGQT